MQNDKGVVALKSYEERIAELDAKREQKEKELAQLKARQKKLQQQQKALERKAADLLNKRILNLSNSLSNTTETRN